MLFFLDSHSKESSHRGTKPVKEETIREGREIVHKRGDGENKWKLFILSAAICRHIKRRDKERHKGGEEPG